MTNLFVASRSARIFWSFIPARAAKNSSQHAVGTIIEGVKQAAKRVPLGNLRILIENTAGMGTAVGSSLRNADLVADSPR